MTDRQKEELKLYYFSLLTEIPEAIETVDFVNKVVIYMYEIYNDLDITSKDIHNVTYLSKTEIRELCKIILRSIDIKYSMHFCRYLNDKTIKRVNPKKDCSKTTAKGMDVRGTNDIEELITTLHEFGHYMHFMNCNFDFDTPKLIHSTEMFAMTFEFYALFYMEKNGILTDDVKKSFLSYMESLYIRSYNIIEEGLGLSIINNYGDLKESDIKKYIKKYGINNEYAKTLEKINTKHFNYNDEYMYIFGLPLALYMGNMMANSYSYKEKFVSNFDKIGELGLDKFLKKMGAYQIISNQSSLEWVMAYAYSYTLNIINENKFDTKKMKLKR